MSMRPPGRLQAVFDGQVDVVARPEDSLIEPYPQAGVPQPLRKLCSTRGLSCELWLRKTS